MTRILGLDLSLTSTGVCSILIEPMDHYDDREVDTRSIKTAGKKDAPLADRAHRLLRIIDQATLGDRPDLVVIEGPSFGQQRQSGQHDRAGLWWQTVIHFEVGENVPVVEVPPALLKRYATGKGNAGKDEVLAAVVRRYPDVPVTGNDEADALVLAAMGARHLGHPIEDLPQLNLTAMEKVRWSS